MSNRIRETFLHNTNGTSDKIYQIQVEELGNTNFQVNKQWGRFQNQSNNFNNLSDAYKEYDKIVKSKLSGGYFITSIPAEQIPQSGNSSSTAPIQSSPNQNQTAIPIKSNKIVREKSGINCQLANPVAENILESRVEVCLKILNLQLEVNRLFMLIRDLFLSSQESSKVCQKG